MSSEIVPVLLAVAVALAALFAAARIIRKTPVDSEQLLRRLNVTADMPATMADDASPTLTRTVILAKSAWLNRWLARADYAKRLRRILHQADIDRPVGSILSISLFGWLGTLCLLFLQIGHFFPALGLSLVAPPLPLLYVLRARRKRFARFEDQMPEAMDLLVGALRVGNSLMTGIGFLAQESREPLRGEFVKCFEEQNYGLDLRTTLTHLAERMPVPDVRFFVAAVLIQKESGGNLAEVLENLGATVRDRSRLKKQVRVHTAQGRATGYILSLLPVVLGLAMYLTHPEGIGILWTNPLGRDLLFAAAGMNVLGSVLIRKVVRIRV